MFHMEIDLNTLLPTYNYSGRRLSRLTPKELHQK
jgi:hypothetical protein